MEEVEKTTKESENMFLHLPTNTTTQPVDLPQMLYL